MMSRIWFAALAACLVAAAAAAAPAKKKPAKKGYDYDKSKYKSYKVLVDEDPAYRFNSKGEPVRSNPAKGKPSGKKKAPGPAKAPLPRTEFPKAEEPAPEEKPKE